jgi:sugar/nucleoside kinase (ribokinase family)
MGLAPRAAANETAPWATVLPPKVQPFLPAVSALSTKVVDRIGAGDAFLSLAALCVGGGLPVDLAAFVGSTAAAIDVQIVCNRDPVTSAGLFRYITTLLK